ncbi:class I SAM-dependent methyltransferase [Aeromicrobium wangtongii]|uniref:Class I SAM-dependent methyltransferase n=1 Tax=Aeromicrobium wangtongii TaxID=2969247 RepID=A0ABY5MAB7_9ACTN|nr:methyltransferase domain-containing protein [Aeromicrobium wangtongii]MCD9199647.1 class I SAM-dependent methyltransferase [Aeromicrobium wangtongii]UUP13998.1 class I SAM-dependent methyltransferase [Aeromicrobium wangtongii]
MDERSRRIIELTDLDHGPGLEIAPLHNPIMRKSDWDVSYVDILPTEELVAHYAGDPNIPGDDIAPVDFPLTGPDGTIRPLSEAAKANAPYSWVLASHVIEHVPDLITWLDDIATLLRDDGALVLAVPDTRYSFDAYRPQTTVGQMLQAHHQQDLIPSVRAVYDYLRSASTITAAEAWADKRPGLAGSRQHGLPLVMAGVEQAKAGRYVDSHVWTFRPLTLIQQINELGELGLCEFIVEKVQNTRPNELEFYAVLRRLPRDRSPERDKELRAKGKKHTNDSPDRFRTLQTPAKGFTVSDRERRLIERKRAAVRAARRVLRRG